MLAKNVIVAGILRGFLAFIVQTGQHQKPIMLAICLRLHIALLGKSNGVIVGHNQAIL